MGKYDTPPRSIRTRSAIWTSDKSPMRRAASSGRSLFSSRSKPQQANFARWGGKSVNRFPSVSGGSASSRGGTLVLRSSKKSLAKTKKLFPNDMFMRYHFSNSLNVLGNGTPGEGLMHGCGPIGFLGMEYTPSSVDAKHLAWMTLDFSKAANYWGENPVGNSILLNPAAATTHGRTSSPWDINKAASTDYTKGNEMILSMDKTPMSVNLNGDDDTLIGHTHDIPAGYDQQAQVTPGFGYTTAYTNTIVNDPSLDIPIQPNHIHFLGGDPWTTDPSVLRPGMDKHTHLTLKGYTGAINSVQPGTGYYRAPNHVISGIDISIRIQSASVSDQWFSIKVLRNVSAEPQAQSGITVSQLQELVNKQTITDSGTYETVWQHSYFLPRMTSLASKANTTVAINKKIRCNYSRSTIRKVSRAPYVKEFGGQWSPYFATDHRNYMYNQMVMVLTSKVVDEQYIGMQSSTISSSTNGHLASNAIAVTTNTAVLSNLSGTGAAETTGFAKFGVSGNVTQRFKIGTFTRNQPTFTFAPGLGEVPSEEGSDHSDSDHSDHDGMEDVPDVPTTTSTDTTDATTTDTSI